jgi:type VI secretion system protein ImpA
METDSAIPISDLTNPLEGSPVGVPLRDSSGEMLPAWRELRDLARTARDKEKQAQKANEDQLFAAINDWRDVKEGALSLLRETTKDLEVAALLLESSVRTDSYEGIADGFELLAELVDRFWYDLVARAKEGLAEEDIDEDSIFGDLLRPIGALDGILPEKLGLLLITDGGDAGEYALWKYEQAVQTAGATEEERERRQAITVDQFTRSVEATAQRNPRYFSRLVATLNRAREQMARLSELCDDRLGSEHITHSPPFGNIRSRLEALDSCLNYTAKDYLTAPEAEETGAEGGAAGAASASSNGSAKGDLNNREDAFRELNRIADFFARTEPLSLLAEQIRQIVDRARLPPERYFAQLIDDRESLKAFFRLVGLKMPSDEESESS